MAERATRTRGNLEAEAKILGYYLVQRPDGCPHPRSSTLRPEHFIARPEHQIWWSRALATHGVFTFHDIGISMADAASLADKSAIPQMVPALEHRIQQEWAMQYVVDGASTLVQRWQKGDVEDTQDAVGFLREVMGYAESGCMSRSRTHREVGREVMHRWGRAVRSAGDVERTLPLPWYDIQHEYRGLLRGKLVVIYGRPSNFKTALARQIIDFDARQGFRGLYWTAEDSSDDLAARGIASATGKLTTHALMTGIAPEKTDPIECERAAYEALDHQGAELLRYIDTPSPSFSNVFGTIRAEAAKGLDIFVFDHSQLIEPDRGRADPDFVSRVARGFQGLCKELDVVGVVLCQLATSTSREMKDRPPKKTDIAHAATWEAAAYTMIGVHAYRDKNEKPTGRLMVDVTKFKARGQRRFTLDIDAAHDTLRDLDKQGDLPGT